jgi:hypothetical protein
MYALNYIHLFGYVIILILSYYCTYMYRPWCILSSIPLGWSLFALVGIGHDCMHGSFSPYPRVNTVLSYLCLNGLLMPRDVWQTEHQVHHTNPGCPEDTMILDGGTVFTEIRNLLCSKHKTTIWGELHKTPLVIGLLFLPLYCVPLIWLSTLCSFAYFGLATHILHPHIRSMDHALPKHAEEIAWNIFPRSHVYCFLSSGLNIHGCHHKNPRWTRSELMHEATGTGYMSIDTVSELYDLLSKRNVSG